ncbi:MAG: hypothetical protein KKE94_13050 [Gammaproteobacteria bacterium]|nr:hypothetical protein [Gammaproteobacteria bacterium]
MTSEKGRSAIWLWVFAGSALVGVAAVGFFYGAHFTSLSEDHKVWGEFGSFFGGVVTPILAFFSFIALLYTIHIQKRELELTRDELSLSRAEVKRSANTMEAQEKNMRFQQFESTFFSMLQMLNSLYTKLHHDLTILETDVTNEKPDLVALAASAQRSDHANGHYFKLITRIIDHIQANSQLIEQSNYFLTLQSVIPDRVFVIYCAKFVEHDEVSKYAIHLRKSGFFHDEVHFEHEHLRKLYRDFINLVDIAISNYETNN